MGDEPTIPIPKDPVARGRLADMAGLTDEERLAIDKWCDLQATENEARARRGLEAGFARAGDGAWASSCVQQAYAAAPGG